MLAKRIIPTILVRGKTAYKGERFNSTRSIGSAVSIAKVHAMRGVDELCILDISATAEGRGPDLDMVRELSAGCFIPLTVGGGVRSLKDIDDLLRAGADKIAIGTAFADLQTMHQASSRFGKQAIVASIDVRGRDVYFNCGTRRADWDVVDWAKVCAELAGEILLTSIERDGTLEGYDLPLIRQVASVVDVPLIAAGGCRDYADMEQAFRAGADACAAGAMFAFTDMTPRQAARYLRSKGLEVRV